MRDTSLTKSTNELGLLFTKEESKEKLWRLVAGYLGSKESDHLTHLDRSDILLFYEKVLQLIDDAYANEDD